MFGWLQSNLDHIVALVVAGLLVGLANKGKPKIKQSAKERGKKFARWAVFVIMAVAGLALVWGLLPAIRWVTGGLNFGGFALGGIIALTLGWHGVAMGTSVIRDLADKVPDEEARQGALWGPTMFVGGGAAVIDLAQNPGGVGSGFSAAVMATITLIYVFMISNRALAAQKHKNGWLWYAFAAMVLGGLVMAPLVAFLDGWLSGVLPGDFVTAIRTIAGMTGVVLIGAAVWDFVCDGVPDKYARIGAVLGVPLAVAFGAIGIAVMTGSATNGAELMSGVF
jgi:hypothetical protein